MSDSRHEPDGIREEYTKRRDAALVSVADNLTRYLFEDVLDGEERIDRISARAKDVDSFLDKAAIENSNGERKYTEPLIQIQDQVGARVVVFYKSDVERIEARIKDFFQAIEHKDVVPDTHSEFGYFGKHMILVLPSDVIDGGIDKTLIPEFFELQIKTLFQHAWSEANHDLGYKPEENTLTGDQIRRVAFTSAQGWGADLIFDELHRELNG